ncbi:MAG: histidine phosphatase family protein [Rhodobacteraceae bacterium]|nr:histidine phosphatase family protein [Paracoccaceae bacterium]
MSLTLILIRHAKSDWNDPHLADHDRPLNARGRRAAPRIGAWLSLQGLTPGAVLCSSARRTQQTWAGIASRLPNAPAPELSRSLYHAEPAQMMQAIRRASASPLILVGHNPGIGSLARLLCKHPPAHSKFDFYPTGATLILRFDAANWSGAKPCRGEVLGFIIPPDLPDPE